MRERSDKSVYNEWRPTMVWFDLYGVNTDDPEEKEKMVKRVLSTRDVTNTIALYAKDQLDKSIIDEEAEDDIDTCHNWSHKAARRAGERAAYRKILKFLPPLTKD